MKVYKRLVQLRDWFLPGSCPLCDAPCPDGGDFCEGCEAALPKLTHCCGRCAVPFENADLDGSLCGDCQQETPAYSIVRAPFRYAPPIDRLIVGAKHAGRLDWVSLLGSRLARHLAARPHRVDAIVPIPLHCARLRERGYNQSLELARPVAKQLGLPIRRYLTRRRATPPQAELSREERRKNVRDAFEADSKIAGLSVALMDDVMTSGATAEMAARCLRKAGASNVEVWVVARA